MGQLRMQGIKADSRCRLSHIVDMDLDVAEYYGAKWSTQVSDDLDSVLADDSLDAVWVSTPTPSHLDIITRSLRAGKAVR